MTLEELRGWIGGRLIPFESHDVAAEPWRSDFDLNPGAAPEASELISAAVLMPLVEHPQGLTVLLTRRADTLRRHTGQIAFPGGRCDPGETPWETALREAEEEIGLDRNHVSLAGLCPRYRTGTGFDITPVVAFVRPGFNLAPNPAEVADVFETPFAFLMDPANHERRFMEQSEGLRRYFYAMPYEDRLIWGATAGMVRALYERLYGEIPSSRAGEGGGEAGG